MKAHIGTAHQDGPLFQTVEGFLFRSNVNENQKKIPRSKEGSYGGKYSRFYIT